MPISIVDDFTQGMITDVVGAPKSLNYLHNAYVRRAGEIVTRGKITSTYQNDVAPAAKFVAGTTQMKFHPDLGSVHGIAIASASGTSVNIFSSSVTSYQILGCPLQTIDEFSASTDDDDFVSPQLTYTQLGQGTNNGFVTINAQQTNRVPIDFIQNMSISQNEVIMSGKTGRLFRWGGSILPEYAYTNGAITSTALAANANRTVTASSTAVLWRSSAEAGMYVMIAGVGERSINSVTYQRPYRIARVISGGGVTPDKLELDTPVDVAVTNATVVVTPLALVFSPSGVWNLTDELPRSRTGAMTIHQGRCFLATPADDSSAYNTVYQNTRIRWSGTIDSYEVNVSTDPDHASYQAFTGIDLWHSNGFTDIPADGGSIVGLVSMGNDLIVVKTGAMYKLSGQTLLNGANTPPYVATKISDSIGAAGEYAYSLCDAGLVIASNHGLYLYDGQSLKSLSNGRIQRYWESIFSWARLSVVALDDKVIVSSLSTTYANTNLVWMINEDYFWVMAINNSVLGSYMNISCGDTYRSDTDGFVAQYAGNFSYTPVSGNTRGLAQLNLTNITHKIRKIIRYDQDSIAGVSASYTTRILSQSLSHGQSSLDMGRINTAYVNCQTDGGGTSSITIYPTRFTHGNKWYDGVLSEEAIDPPTTPFYEENSPSYALKDNSNIDRIHRIPINGVSDSSASKVHWVGSGTFIRLFAIGVEYKETTVYGSTFNGPQT